MKCEIIQSLKLIGMALETLIMLGMMIKSIYFFLATLMDRDTVLVMKKLLRQD